MESQLTVKPKELATFCQQNQIRVLSLFGSAVTDEFTDESDIDLLVEFEPDAKIGFLALARMQRELAEMFQRPVDLVPRNGLKPMIREQVLSQAELLYAN
ncbi:MAG: nucleotidyltransferase family protein [Chloroflexi bacterium]|nr:nucleotidyltransferase family protein [Chloroflexota bacterium]